jgi:hypothetical protein
MKPPQRIGKANVATAFLFPSVIFAYVVAFVIGLSFATLTICLK